MSFFVYLLASGPYGTLYCGHTEDLGTRMWQHREKAYGGFTARYGVTRLVWYELHTTRETAIRRERQIKKWNRQWKIRLIEETNQSWADLYPSVTFTQETEVVVAKFLETQAQLGSPPARGRAES